MSEPDDTAHSSKEDAELLKDAREILEYDPEFAAFLFQTAHDSAAHKAEQNGTTKKVELQRIALEMCLKKNGNTQ